MIQARRRLVLVLGLSLPALVVGLLAACTPSHPQSTFDTLGPVAESQVDLFYIIFWVGMGVLALVMAVLLYTAVRFRRRPGEGDPEQIHGHTRLEVAWTIAPSLLLIVVAVPSVITIFDNANSPVPPEQGGLSIVATGHQWWFEFEYPNHDIVTANELHIPVGEPVNVMLHSVDVIHSFWIPKIAGKVDMIPNNNNQMWLQADEPGTYYGQCAEFCGESHANMRFKVIAQPKAEFDAWLLAQAQEALVPSDDLEREGEALFMSREGGCFACHTVEGSARARGTTGPNMTHFASRGDFAGSIMENTQENLRKWLQDPQTMKPGNVMARDGGVYNGSLDALTEPQVSALVAYLRSLK